MQLQGVLLPDFWKFTVMDAKTYQRLAEKATGTGSKSLASDRIALEMGVVAAG